MCLARDIDLAQLSELGYMGWGDDWDREPCSIVYLCRTCTITQPVQLGGYSIVERCHFHRYSYDTEYLKRIF
jgi:hypothetical protein